MATSETAHADLEAIRAAVHESVTSSTKFQMLNTRLIIQTGVNLDAIAPEQNNDLALQTRVREALGRMGIELGERAR